MPDFHKEVKIWSKIKHQILRNYLALLLGKLGRPGTRVYNVDGFAGQGRYEDGNPGSPLIAAELAANPKQSSRRDVLRCINVERDPVTFANLELHTREYVKQGLVTNLQGSFEEHLETILERIKDWAAFFFIDPFGTTSVEFSTLERIARRSTQAKTEVLVRFDDARVKRLLAWARNHKDSSTDRLRLTAGQFLRRVRNLTSDEAIEDVLLQDLSTSESLVKGYVDAVKKRGLFSYGLAYPIRNPVTENHHYFLVHFCNHEDGYHYMANFMALAERSAVQEARQAKQDLLFTDADTPKQLEMLEISKDLEAQTRQPFVSKIAAQLPTIFREYNMRGQRIQNRRIFAAIVDKFGYQTTRREWVEALRLLEKNGTVRMDGAKDSDFACVTE